MDGFFYTKKNLSNSLILPKSESSSISNCNLFVKSKLKMPDKDFALTTYFLDIKRHSNLHNAIISVNFFIFSSESNFMIRLFIFIHLHIFYTKKLFYLNLLCVPWFIIVKKFFLEIYFFMAYDFQMIEKNGSFLGEK